MTDLGTIMGLSEFAALTILIKLVLMLVAPIMVSVIALASLKFMDIKRKDVFNAATPNLRLCFIGWNLFCISLVVVLVAIHG